jgi:hypothetical protein
MLPSKPTLEAPITGQALRRCVAERHTAEWMAYARALRVAGYRVDPDGLTDQLLRNGRANVQDAFGNEVTVQVRLPRPMAPELEDADVALAGSDPLQVRDYTPAR